MGRGILDSTDVLMNLTRRWLIYHMCAIEWHVL